MQWNAACVLNGPAGHTAHIGDCGVATDMEYIPAAHPISRVGVELGTTDGCTVGKWIGCAVGKRQTTTTKLPVAV